MTLNTYAVTNNYKVGRGRTKIQLYSAANVLQRRARWLGNNPAFTLSVESENLQHFSSQSGIREVDADIPLSITRTSQIRVDNISKENLALFLSGTISTVSQSAGAATEDLAGVAPNTVFQLGETSNNLAGLRNVTSITATIKATARANSTAYLKGQIYKPATPNDHIYVCTVAGTSAGTPPTFTTNGTTFTDGTATFLDLGDVSSLADATDFIADESNALLSIPSTGALAAAYDAAIAAGLEDSEFSIEITAGYTKVAMSRVEINAGSTASVHCKIVFKADNAYGDNDDVVIEDCTLRPSGEFAMITEDGFAEMTFDVGINIRDSNTPPVKYVKPAVAA